MKFETPIESAVSLRMPLKWSCSGQEKTGAFFTLQPCSVPHLPNENADNIPLLVNGGNCLQMAAKDLFEPHIRSGHRRILEKIRGKGHGVENRLKGSIHDSRQRRKADFKRFFSQIHNVYCVQ